MASEFSAGSLTANVSAILQGKAEMPVPDVKPALRAVAGELPAGDVVDQLKAELSGDTVELDGEEVEIPATQSSLSLEGLAEKLGVTVAELYELEIPMPDGEETLKLSDLKDKATQYKRDEAERLGWETERATERNQLANDRAEMETLLGMMPASARTPALLRQAQQQLEQLRQSEAVKLVRRVPEWKDPVQFAADMETIEPHIKEFGFSNEELLQVYDHRLLSYIRHNALREQKIQTMLEDARSRKQRKGSPDNTNGRQPANKRQPQPRSRNDRVSAVSALLRESK